MAPREKKSYFLYGEGRAPDVLCLGNLILGSYSNPTLGNPYTHPQLSGEELSKHASLTSFKDRVLHAKHEPSYGIQLDGAQLFDFGVSWDATHETILTANEGTRMELKEEFPQYPGLTKRSKGRREAQIVAFGCKQRVRHENEVGAEADNLDVHRVVFIGGNEDIQHLTEQDRHLNWLGFKHHYSAFGGSSWSFYLGRSGDVFEKVGSVWEERLVWAAQYRKLEAKYIKLRPGEEAKLPRTLPLYPDITSDGTLRNQSDEMPTVQVELGADNGDGEEEKDDSLSTERYYECLAKAIEEFEECIA